MDSLLHYIPPEVSHQYLIFRTNISDCLKERFITPLLDHHPMIGRWCLDTTDRDNVLKVQPIGELEAYHVMGLINSCGFLCEELED